MRLPWLLPLVVSAAFASAQDTGQAFLRVTRPEPLPPPLADAVGRLETTRLRAHLAFLTDPRQEGRGLGTRGLAATARYLAHLLKAVGIPPLGASVLQSVPLREVQPGRGTVRLQLPSGALSFQANQNAILPSIEPGQLSGPLIFVGYGIQEPALGHDDYRGLEVRGKVVLFLDGMPSGAPWHTPELMEKYAPPRPGDRYDSRLALLEKLGARAAIALEADLAPRIAAGHEPIRPYVLAAAGVPAPGEPPLARVALTPELRALLQPGLTGTATLTIQGRLRALLGLNVLGELKGSDPRLRREAILLGAHMDHLGQPGGVLHPGADDNGSGVAALLEIARSLAASPVRPKRTVLFAFWTGEEEGKFGSNHYTRHPRWPLAATTYLNLDMIGHPWTAADLTALVKEAGPTAPKAFLEGLEPTRFAEPGLPTGHPELSTALAQAGRGLGLSLHLDWTDGKNGGSDYRAFARREVPFIRFFGSYFPEYHQPGDTLDSLDPEQVKRMAALILSTAWLLADR